MATQDTELNLDELAALEAEATPGPWYVGHFDDEHFMSAITVEAYIPDDDGEERCERVAATLIQQPRYIDASDQRWSENAKLIAEMRTALPELIRLARIGLAAGQ